VKKLIALLVIAGMLGFSLGCGGSSGSSTVKKTEAGSKSTETTEKAK
jgi:hypothetical protein